MAGAPLENIVGKPNTVGSEGIFGAFGGLIKKGASEKYNRALSERSIAIETQNAELKEADFRRKASRAEATKKAGFAKRGIALSGSALDVAASEALDREREVLNIKYESELKKGQDQLKINESKLRSNLNQQDFLLRTGTTVLNLTTKYGK